MNLRNLELIFLQLVDELSSIELAVAATRLDDLGLFFEREVLPGETGADVFLEERQNLVVRDCAWICEVVYADFLVLGEEDGGRKEIVEDGVGIGDVNYALVLGDLGDEVTGVEVIRDGHAQSEDEAVGVVFHDLQMLTCERVVTAKY